MNLHPEQIKIPAYFMRGGTSNGVFFKLSDLPITAQSAGDARDQFLLRVIGSPDPYAKQIDGMGGATSSSSKCVIISKSSRPEHDIDYLFGQVAIDKAFVDWSGNCGNLTAAVGSFAIQNGLIPAHQIPKNGTAIIKVWQANIGKSIVIHVPIYDGKVQEVGDFELDGVTFPAAEIKIDFMEPAASGELFPTGRLIDELMVPDIGKIDATLINAGIPTIFVNAKSLGFNATEEQKNINSNPSILQKLERIRAYGAIKMGLVKNIEAASQQQHTPKIAWVAPPQDYTASSGKQILRSQIDLNVRAMSMGLLHHAMMGTAAVAIASAAAIPGTIVARTISSGNQQPIRFGHPSGTLKVGAEVIKTKQQWLVTKVSMSRSARTLMEGMVRVPAVSF